MAKSPGNSTNHSSEQSMKLPAMIEVVFTLSKLTVVLVGIIVMVVTFANGNPYWVAMVRGCITVLSLGLLVWFISWILVKGVLESVKSMLKEAERNEPEMTSGSMDTNA